MKKNKSEKGLGEKKEKIGEAFGEIGEAILDFSGFRSLKTYIRKIGFKSPAYLR